MAKRRQKKQDAATVKARPERSLLGQAFRAYQSGDVVVARRAAQALLSRAPTPDDEADAKEIAKTLFEAEAADVSARKVAEELLSRTRGDPRSWYFLAAAALLVVLMIVLAVARA